MTDMTQFEVIILGSGQAGNPLAAAFSDKGKRVAMVERAAVGGTCGNYGCTPTKTMVASAEAAHMARRAADYGVHVGEVSVDMVKVRERKRGMVKTVAGGQREAPGEGGACGADSRRRFVCFAEAGAREVE